jgi:hypothetical protein
MTSQLINAVSQVEVFHLSPCVNGSGAVSDQKFPNSLCPCERIPGRTCGCNGVYLKLGKGLSRGSIMGPGGSWKQRVFLFSSAFKTYLTYEKGRICDSQPPIIHE